MDRQSPSMEFIKKGSLVLASQPSRRIGKILLQSHPNLEPNYAPSKTGQREIGRTNEQYVH